MLRILLILGVFIASAAIPLSQVNPAQQAINKGSRSPDAERFWRDLGDTDAAKAYQAIIALVRTPEMTVSLIGSRLKPAAAPDSRQVEQWISDLNSPRFPVRKQASRKLEELGGLAEGALRAASGRTLPLELHRRLERLLEKLAGPLTLPKDLRAIRTVEILERIGTPEARKLLRTYAAGAQGSRLTRDSALALERLKKAPAGLPAKSKPDKGSPVDLYGDPLPAGAVGRLGTVRFRRHSSGLIGLAFLPDGKTILTASREHEVQLWDAASGRLVREIRTEPISILAFALSADGKHFAVAGSHPFIAANVPPPGEIRIFNLSTGKVVRSFAREGRDIYNTRLALSSDGKLLFSLGNKGILRIEEVGSGKEVLQKKFRPDNSAQLALSPDGKRLALATGLNTHNFYIWEWQGKEPHQFEIPGYGVYWMTFSPDGELLATCGYAFEQGLRIWDVARGRVLFTRSGPDTQDSYLGQPAFTPDGKTLLVPVRSGRGSRIGRTELLDPRTGMRQGFLEIPSTTMSVSADSQRLAVASGQGVSVWNLATRKEIGPAYDGHSMDPTHIVISPKGLIVTTGNDNSVRLWDGATTRQRRKIVVDGWVRDIALAPDGNLLAASSFDDLVHVWNPHTGREIYRLAGHGEIGGRRTLQFLSDSKGLLSWGDDFYLRLWDMKTGKARFEHAIRPAGVTIPDEEDRGLGKEEFMGRLGNALVTPDGRFFILQIGGHFHRFDIKTGKEVSKFASAESIWDRTVLSPDGKWLLVSAWGNFQIKNHPVSLIDALSGKVRQRHILPGSVAGPVAFSADGRAFATSVEEPEKQILVYEVASGKVRHTIRGYRGRVSSLAFFPDGRRLVSGHGDSTLLLWNLTSK